MELHVFARFHASPGREDRMASLLREQTRAVRQEPGCVFIEAARSRKDPGQFFLFSRWVDEPAFQVHADLPSTDRFIATLESLSSEPVDVHRSRPLDG